MTEKAEIARRFWRHVEMRPTAKGCLEWTASRHEDGYGYMRFDGKTQKAHRVRWWLEHDEWPPLLRHSCDNAACVALEHLVPGTQLDNVRDRGERGRTSRGEKHYAAKLTEAMVLEARRLRTDGVGYTAIGKLMGVTHNVIKAACTGKTWKCVVSGIGKAAPEDSALSPEGVDIYPVTL